MSAPLLLGIDIGGTKIAAGVIGPAREVRHRTRTATPRSGGSDVLRAVLDLIAEIRSSYDVAGIGVGSPGVVRNGDVRFASDILPGWAGTAVAGPLSDATGLPVRVDNDVRVMSLAEAVSGAGVGYGRVLVASVGTGVGGALVFAGIPQRGGHGTAGEIGHLLVPGRGAIPCGCGRFDHLEAVASGPAIEAAAARRAGGPRIPLVDLAREWESGRGDRCVLTGAATTLGRALAGLASAVDVDAVVVGGGVAQVGEPFLAPLRAAFAGSVIAPLRSVPVTGAALSTDAPLIGAAELLRRNIHEQEETP